ncbi:cation-translocating P-type ATPase C-terminal domain-containing protein [Streptomyces sp. NPDC006265]|uniref:cation-translocating P-type ATPase C-terminal domain-containing protein n=1 Tax=Streptomyces sp. NPDC006265 TaxID=3156740 RepID=UPI00339F6FE0
MVGRPGRGTKEQLAGTRNRTLWLCLVGVLPVQVIAAHLPWARSVFGTVPLSAGQWAVCLGTAPTVSVGELAVCGARSAARRWDRPDTVGDQWPPRGERSPAGH